MVIIDEQSTLQIIQGKNKKCQSQNMKIRISVQPKELAVNFLNSQKVFRGLKKFKPSDLSAIF